MSHWGESAPPKNAAGRFQQRNFLDLSSWHFDCSFGGREANASIDSEVAMKLEGLLIPQEGSALAESAITKPPEMAGGGGATLMLLRAAEAHALLGADPRWMTWITGRPGSGKAALAERVAEAVAARGIPVVMVDATAPRRVCREAARELIPSFAEVQELCPAGIFMARERGAFERLLSELSARLIPAPLSDVDTEVERGLQRVGEFLRIDRASLLEYVPGGAPVRITWAEGGDERPWPVNLILNGLDALRESPAGDRALVLQTARDSAAAVRVAVRDSGTGIAEADSEHIFRAFYTTKTGGSEWDGRSRGSLLKPTAGGSRPRTTRGPGRRSLSPCPLRPRGDDRPGDGAGLHRGR